MQKATVKHLYILFHCNIFTSPIHQRIAKQNQAPLQFNSIEFYSIIIES